MELKFLIPIIISSFSLCISAYVAYMQFRSKRENLKVTLNMGVLTHPNGSMGDWHYSIEAVNVGERALTIRSAELKLPNEKFFAFPYVQSHLSLPYDLTMGKSCFLMVSLRQMGYTLLEAGYQGSIIVTPQIKTQSGKTFSGKKTEINIADLLK